MFTALWTVFFSWLLLLTGHDFGVLQLLAEPVKSVAVSVHLALDGLALRTGVQHVQTVVHGLVGDEGWPRGRGRGGGALGAPVQRQGQDGTRWPRRHRAVRVG